MTTATIWWKVSKAEIGFAVVAAATSLALVWDPFVGSFLYRERNRGEVLALYQAMQLGMAGSAVEDERQSGRYPHLRFVTGDDGSWYVSTPLEFGAKNWVLLVDVVDGHVSAVRIRTEDGLHDHPAEAPRDKESVATAGKVDAPG